MNHLQIFWNLWMREIIYIFVMLVLHHWHFKTSLWDLTLASLGSKISSCRQASILNRIISPRRSKLLWATSRGGPDTRDPLLFRAMPATPPTTTDGSTADSLSSNTCTICWSKPRVITNSWSATPYWLLLRNQLSTARHSQNLLHMKI